MGNITCAWELGDGLGHVASLSTVGGMLAEHKHNVTYILKNPKSVLPFLAKENATVLLSPRWLGHNPGLPQPIANYTEILMHRGYYSRTILFQLISRWRDILAKAKTDLLIVDNSPTALLAAYSLNINCISIGTGFSSPPRTSPLPVFRSDLKANPERFISNETLVLNNINSVLESVSNKRINALGDIFNYLKQDVLTSYPELDPYQGRENTDYIGSINHCFSHTNKIGFNVEGKKTKLFVYLKKEYKSLEDVLYILSNHDSEKIVYINGLSKTQAERFQNERMIISQKPLHTQSVLEKCDAVLCHAGHGLVCESLLSGRPLLLLPMVYEQYLTAKRVDELGMGSHIDHSSLTSNLTDALNNLNDTNYKINIDKFSSKYNKLNYKTKLLTYIKQWEEDLF